MQNVKGENAATIDAATLKKQLVEQFLKVRTIRTHEPNYQSKIFVTGLLKQYFPETLEALAEEAKNAKFRGTDFNDQCCTQ